MKKWYAVTATVAAGAFALACADSPTALKKELAKAPGAPAATQVNGAAFTTTNPDADRPGGVDGGTPVLCRNGQDLQAGTVNCNLYASKRYVWLNGGPIAAQMGGAGDYFFAVLVPSGQGSNDNPNDGTVNNLSDLPGGDAWTNRVFTLDANGAITNYAGTHTFANGKIRLMPYDNTTNPGGVYIMAVCRVPSSIAGTNPPGVVPSDCKYDAFKVREAVPPPGVDAITTTIAITPTATNGIGEAHTFTVNYSVQGGTRPYSINITPSISPVIAFATNCPNDPTTPLVTTLADPVPYTGSCTMTINSSVAGVFTANASIDVIDSGDPQLQASDATDALGGTGPAIKTYVDGSLTWNKTSNYPGGPLAGATFKIQRSLARDLTTPVADAAITGITDCVASPCAGLDKDPAGGAFLVQGLAFGRWTITETAAPALYDLASPVSQVVDLTDLTTRTAAASLPFVDPVHLFGETATVQGFPWMAVNGAPDNWFMYAPWVTQGGQIGISTVGPPAGTNLIAGQHYIAGRVTGTRGLSANSTSITITLANGFTFSGASSDVKINPMSCSPSKYVQPGQFSIKVTRSSIYNSVTVSGLSNTNCYGVHVDVLRNPIINP